MIYKRHGGAYDRGSADRYYRRPFNPHYYEGGTMTSKLVEQSEMTPEEIAEYTLGWNEETERKDYR